MSGSRGGFDERERAEEKRYEHEQELAFKVRNRRNRLFGQWIAQTYLKLHGEAAQAYAKDAVLADLTARGPGGLLDKVRTDLASSGEDVPAPFLEERLRQMETEARQQVMDE